MKDSALKRWRDRNGFSQREAARRLGMSLYGYQKNENGTSNVSDVLLYAAAAIENGIQKIY